MERLDLSQQQTLPDPPQPAFQNLCQPFSLHFNKLQSLWHKAKQWLLKNIFIHLKETKINVYLFHHFKKKTKKPPTFFSFCVTLYRSFFSLTPGISERVMLLIDQSDCTNKLSDCVRIIRQSRTAELSPWATVSQWPARIWLGAIAINHQKL